MAGEVQTGGLSRVVDLASAGTFAAALGYSVLMLSESQAGSAAAAAGAFALALTILGRIADTPRFAIADFAVGAVEPWQADELPELLLADLAELLLTDVLPDGSELLLDDRLVSPGGDSRVIRLFDPRTLPTAGELHEQIEHHVRARDGAAYPDATAQLHQALAELRSSLRSVSRQPSTLQSAPERIRPPP